MSDEQYKTEEPEVEGHVRRHLNDEEPSEDDEVEAHVRRGMPRKDAPRKD